MSTSASIAYWNVAENVRDALRDLHVSGEAMYADLENTDDPLDTADALAGIHKDMVKLAEQIALNIAPLRKAGAALAAIPGVKV